MEERLRLSRRELLRVAGLSVGALGLKACTTLPQLPDASPTEPTPSIPAGVSNPNIVAPEATRDISISPNPLALLREPLIPTAIDCLPNEHTGLPILSEAAVKEGIKRLEYLKQVIPYYLKLSEYPLREWIPGGDASVLENEINNLHRSESNYRLLWHASPHSTLARYDLIFGDPRPRGSQHFYFNMNIYYPYCDKPETIVIKGELLHDPYSSNPVDKIHPDDLYKTALNYFNFSPESKWVRGKIKEGSKEIEILEVFDEKRSVRFQLREDKRFIFVASSPPPS